MRASVERGACVRACVQMATFDKLRCFTLAIRHLNRYSLASRAFSDFAYSKIQNFEILHTLTTRKTLL